MTPPEISGEAHEYPMLLGSGVKMLRFLDRMW